MPLSQEDKQELSALVKESIRQEFLDTRIESQKHYSHHLWIDRRIRQEQRRQEFWEGVKKTLAGALVIAMVGGLGWLGTQLWAFFKFIISKGGS